MGAKPTPLQPADRGEVNDIRRNGDVPKRVRVQTEAQMPQRQRRSKAHASWMSGKQWTTGDWCGGTAHPSGYLKARAGRGFDSPLPTSEQRGGERPSPTVKVGNALFGVMGELASHPIGYGEAASVGQAARQPLK